MKIMLYTSCYGEAFKQLCCHNNCFICLHLWYTHKNYDYCDVNDAYIKTRK